MGGRGQEGSGREAGAARRRARACSVKGMRRRRGSGRVGGLPARHSVEAPEADPPKLFAHLRADSKSAAGLRERLRGNRGWTHGGQAHIGAAARGGRGLPCSRGLVCMGGFWTSRAPAYSSRPPTRDPDHPVGNAIGSHVISDQEASPRQWGAPHMGRGQPPRERPTRAGAGAGARRVSIWLLTSRLPKLKFRSATSMECPVLASAQPETRRLR